MKTDGVSPKLIAAVITAVVTYVLGQTVLELPPIATVAGQAVLVALAAFAAPAGSVSPPVASSSDDRLHPEARAGIAGESGLALIEALLAVFILLVILVVLLRLI